MRSKTAFKTMEEFLFQDNKTFVIPNYQRGYKWAVKEKEKADTAVEKLMDNLLNADKNQQYFLQGVTVVEENDKIILIDGQQRTTTLYLLLWCLGKEKIENITLNYDIREQSKKFIHNLKNESFDIENFDKENKFQDVFYFKKAIKQINSKIEKLKTDESKFKEFIDFLLKKVTILYIVIDKDKATKTFTMMNGSKATMLQEELVKAEMLRMVSFPDLKGKQVSTSVDDNLNDLKEIIAKDWEINALRSRYAREWDKWLYWWNRKDVKDFFGVENPMGLLLKFYYTRKQIDNLIDESKKFSFENFRELFIGNEKLKTKLTFKELRDLQKSFEDIFNNAKLHNYLKMSLLCSINNDDKYDIIDYFIHKKHEKNLIDDYAKWRLIGSTHRQIVKGKELREDEDKKEDKAAEVLNKLSGSFVYQNAYDFALKQLLRLNVEEDNKLFDGKGRKLDFSIYGNKSLEHIHPKSKAYYKKEIVNEDESLTIVYKDGNDIELGVLEPKGIEWLNRDEMGTNCSEHCIGNLVLLDKNENSKFNNKPFDAKKEVYFNVDEVFKSRNLLHTISVFANSNWKKEHIQENQKKFIVRFKQDYGI
jgi:hypothetical protein